RPVRGASSIAPNEFKRQSRRGLGAVQVGRARVAVAEALDQLFPHRPGVRTEGLRGVERLGVPVTGLDFLLELAGLPADEAGEVARVVRRRLDDAVDAVGFRGHEEVV